MKPYFVNVNTHAVKANAARLAAGGCVAPVFSVRHGRGGKPAQGHAVEVRDAAGAAVARLAYEPYGGLACGARAFLVCHFEPGIEAAAKALKAQVSADDLAALSTRTNMRLLTDDLTVSDLLLILQTLVKVNPKGVVRVEGFGVRKLEAPPKGGLKLSFKS